MLKRRRAAIINKQSTPYGMEKVEYLENPFTSDTTGNAALFEMGDFNIDFLNGDSIKMQTEHQIPHNLPNNWTHQGGEGFHADGRTLDFAFVKSTRPIGGNNYDTAVVNGWCSIYDVDGGTYGTFDWAAFKPNQTPDTEWHTLTTSLSKDFHTFQIDDYVTSSETRQNKKWRTPASLCVFGFWGDNAYYATKPLLGRKKYFKFWLNNKLTRDLIPALDRTGTPCMFDKVTRKRFYNAGTGQFGYPIKEGIPNNYTKLEYLESDGNQFIRISDIAFTSGDDIEVSSLLQINNLNNVRRAEGLNGVYLFWGIMGDNTLYAGNGTGRWGTTNYIADDGWHIFTNKNTSAEQGFYVDDSLVFSGAKITSNHNPLYLDIWKCYGVGYSFGNRKKWWRVTLNDEVKHNLIPYLDPTGTPCMYDTVSQVLFYNSGTGDFLYPSPTSSTTYSMRRPRAEYAKMTDTGVRRLYHVPVDYEGSIEEYANEHGFKLLNETESPNEEGKYYAFRWVETDTELTTEWYETEPPVDELGNPIENIDEPQSSTFNLQRPAPIDTTVYSNKSQWAMMTDTGVRRLYHTPKGYEGTLEEYATQNGFKQLIETESPNEDGKYYSFKWVETDDVLMTEWFEVEPPQEEIIEEILDNPIE